MKKVLLISALTIGLFSCKKAPVVPTHNIQFSSNVFEYQYYSLIINGNSHSIESIYNIEGPLDITLNILAAGGDTINVNGNDSLWIMAGIIVDGKSVASCAQYRDATLRYRSE